MWFVIIFHVAQWHCISRLEQQSSSLGVVEHHPECLWYRGNVCMHVVIAYVWMAPIIVSYTVHLLAYAPGGCSRLFTLSCICSWMHCLNCTLDIGCDIWFVFYREFFSLSRVFRPGKSLGEATFSDLGNSYQSYWWSDTTCDIKAAVIKKVLVIQEVLKLKRASTYVVDWIELNCNDIKVFHITGRALSLAGK